MVDSNILHILKRRVETCHLFNRPDHRQVCAEVTDQWQNALTNFHIKCKYIVLNNIYLQT